MDEYEIDLTPLGESVDLLRKGDQDGALTRMLNFAVSVWAGIPGLGNLTEALTAALASVSSRGKMRRAIRELEAETDQIRSQKAIAAAVIDALEDTVHGQELPKDDRSQALLALEQRKESIEAAITARQRSLRIRQGVVDGGATGLDVGDESTRSIDVVQDRITGPGTIGVRVK